MGWNHIPCTIHNIIPLLVRTHIDMCPVTSSASPCWPRQLQNNSMVDYWCELNAEDTVRHSYYWKGSGKVYFIRLGKCPPTAILPRFNIYSLKNVPGGYYILYFWDLWFKMFPCISGIATSWVWNRIPCTIHNCRYVSRDVISIPQLT